MIFVKQMFIVGEMTEILHFSFKATTRKIQVIEAVLFVAEIHAEGLPVTCQAVQPKAGELAKSLGQSSEKLVGLSLRTLLKALSQLIGSFFLSCT